MLTYPHLLLAAFAIAGGLLVWLSLRAELDEQQDERLVDPRTERTRPS